jgi:hypothetical protein
MKGCDDVCDQSEKFCFPLSGLHSPELVAHTLVRYRGRHSHKVLAHSTRECQDNHAPIEMFGDDLER